MKNRLKGIETGDGEEETMDGEREEVNDGKDCEDCEEPGVNKSIGESDHLEADVGEDGERALSEEDKMDDMFRSSNLIIIPFPRRRDCNNQNSDTIGDPDVNEEAESESGSKIEEEQEESESKDTDEENSDKSNQVRMSICFPPSIGKLSFLFRQATSLDSLWMLEDNLKPGADLSTTANLLN